MSKKNSEILTGGYEPTKFEKNIYKKWEDSGFFNPDKCIENGIAEKDAQSFTIVMPPPNANGRLHVGHALFVTIEDILIRYNRMYGKRTLWLPGADHAGFETQTVYEKFLEKQSKSRFDFSREDLYKDIFKFVIDHKGVMEQDMKDLGASCDWSRDLFTLDPKVVATVQETFKKMFKDGLIYRGKRSINWCTKHQTGLSDLETENKEEKAKLYYFKYGPFEIVTARPETKFGDKYVVMHPEDKRYSEYKHGDKLIVEWINGPIEATIIKDEIIDMEFGTGVMTITPWHSAIDFDLAKKYNLDYEQIIDWNGKLLPIAEEFAGMKIKDAREKIVEKLQAKGLVTKIEENYVHNIKVCYKCNNILEPQVNDQWFVKMAPLADLAIKAIEENKINFYPENAKNNLIKWYENIIDWNISRQIVWGIRIPAQTCMNCNLGFIDKNINTDKCGNCKGGLKEETDTFDTWFSSGQWPLLTCGYNSVDGDSLDLQNYFPTSVMETGYDILYKWVGRMIFFSLYLKKEVPFKNVYLHGLVNDKNGQKMSKSKGNVVSPIDMIEKYGCDALRMGLMVGAPAGSDTNLSEDKIKGYKHFANKIWNVTKFLDMNGVFENNPHPTLPEGEGLQALKYTLTSEKDKELINELESLVKETTKEIENFNLHLAADRLYQFFWKRFADEIIEESKIIFQNKPELTGLKYSESEILSRKKSLKTMMEIQLKLLHPFMPFVTEVIWSEFLGKEKMLMVETWPKV
jgi:valyl-tRNA synthetase